MARKKEVCIQLYKDTIRADKRGMASAAADEGVAEELGMTDSKRDVANSYTPAASVCFSFPGSSVLV